LEGQARKGERQLLSKVLSCPAAGGEKLEFQPDLALNSFQMGPAGHFSLFSDLNLGKISRKSPRHGGQASLSSELVLG
jgi:hypothetical protein